MEIEARADTMINSMDLSGRTILVTGASSGIGLETSRCLSELGARVVLVARNKERLFQAASTLVGSGHQIESFDLSLVDEIPNWLLSIVNTLGPLDGIVHSAGLVSLQPIRLWNAQETDTLMKVNVYACFALTKAFRQRVAHKQSASLVFLSSAAGIRGEMGRAVYSASKAAIIGLTRSLALELVRDGLRVNCVAPGMVAGEMMESSRDVVLTNEQLASIGNKHPLGLGKPRDVANAISFLLADASRWITGTTLVIDGGYTI